MPLPSWVAEAAELSPPVDVAGPRVRLGLAWAVVTVLAVAAGPVATAAVFAPAAFFAAGQARRSWRHQPRRPYGPVAVVGAFVCSLAGAVDPVAVIIAVVLVAIAGVTAAHLRVGGRDWDDRLTLAIAILIGVGAAVPSLIRDDLGLMPALVFIALVHVVDASTFIVGSGASSRWEGPAAGGASAGAVGLAVAAVLVPPFRGMSPWLLAGLVALLVPAGGMAATALIGRREARVPVLRRLDCYLVAGPVWALAAHLLLDV